jgi:3D (Asp-Asp-Asp) domain-containing protein
MDAATVSENVEMNNTPNGNEKTRPRVVSNDVSSSKVDAEITTETAKTVAVAAKSGAFSVSSSAISYSATAYALRGRTATGSGVRRGIIAADPRHLPLGTRVQINAGAWSGTYLVADTGGAIRGRKIDVWVPNNGEARKFGRRKVMLTVMTKAR